MRKVVSGLFVSLDGVARSPDEWQFAFDEEMGASLAETLETADTILLGRVTFTEWAGYWPSVTGGEDAGFAEWINDSPKYVVSTTLEDVAGWANSTLVNGDLPTAIEKLKAGAGKGVAVAGSPTLVRSLLEQDLLDELVLLIHPGGRGGSQEAVLRRRLPEEVAAGERPADQQRRDHREVPSGALNWWGVGRVHSDSLRGREHRRGMGRRQKIPKQVPSKRATMLKTSDDQEELVMRRFFEAPQPPYRTVTFEDFGTHAHPTHPEHRHPGARRRG
ncbi:dihydrofolate reductase family protein [Streptomyces sp. TP-A0874]|uniref:dihydrofolate reductase family protein n=1 Tax=Streptomyces sp. TP-A0874 TaxID=549819 RepID=UPI000A836EDB|nr:dihydrofolate reductase family protein [Streptomyces sp. TP-A0874]